LPERTVGVKTAKGLKDDFGAFAKKEREEEKAGGSKRRKSGWREKPKRDGQKCVRDSFYSKQPRQTMTDLQEGRLKMEQRRRPKEKRGIQSAPGTSKKD